jgi:hypothetical protein
VTIRGLQFRRSGSESFGFKVDGSVVNQGVVESNGCIISSVGFFSEGFHLADGNRFSDTKQKIPSEYLSGRDTLKEE